MYYFINDKGFFFGSEIKFIKSLCKVEFTKNKEQIYKNLFFGYKSLNKTKETFFNNILCLESSSNLTIDLNLKPEIKKYWKPTLKIKKNMTANEASDGVKEHLINNARSSQIRAAHTAYVQFFFPTSITRKVPKI